MNHFARLALAALVLAIPASACADTFDVEQASRAYLDLLQGTAREESDAYFEGGYWLILWSTLVGVLADGLLLHFRLSARFRDWAERLVKRRWAVTGLAAMLYTLAGTLLTLPWIVYTQFFRERQYALMNQTFGGWFGDYLIETAITLMVVPVLLIAVYAGIRRSPRRWWLFGTGIAAAFIGFSILISPVYIDPLFNTYKEMPAGPLRERIVGMAEEHRIPADHIYVFDASRQSKRISANVSGLGPTIRISLNDNLLNRTSPAEVAAVMGHEIGHYVLNHVWRMVAMLSALFGLMFFIASRAGPALIRRYGERWGVRDLADPASLPVLGILLSVLTLLATPATNSIVRISESEADLFGLNASKEPDGFARVAMRLSEYRKIEPGPIEELLFYDHPSGATRVRMAMQWKKDHVPDAAIVKPEPLPLEGK